MKLLFDENLSPSLVKMLAGVFPGSQHVAECGLGSSEDTVVWDYAKEHGFAIISKDSDFYERSILAVTNPKVIWLRLPNCSTSEIAELLRVSAPTISEFMQHATETCLILGRSPAKK